MKKSASDAREAITQVDTVFQKIFSVEDFSVTKNILSSKLFCDINNHCAAGKATFGEVGQDCQKHLKFHIAK